MFKELTKKKIPKDKTVTNVEFAARRDYLTTLSKNGIDRVQIKERCFDAGAALAASYLANIRQMAGAGLMASRIMDEGCESHTGPGGEDCVQKCKTGFKVEARDKLQ